MQYNRRQMLAVSAGAGAAAMAGKSRASTESATEGELIQAASQPVLKQENR